MDRHRPLCPGRRPTRLAGPQGPGAALYEVALTGEQILGFEHLAARLARHGAGADLVVRHDLWAALQSFADEGWSVAEFPDGRVGSGAGPDGVSVLPLQDEVSEAPGAVSGTAGRTSIGWSWVCTCGQSGSLWRRVPAAGAADPARHLVHWASPDDQADPRSIPAGDQQLEDWIRQE